MHITSPYRINYSIGGRIYRLRLKSMVNYETYQQILKNKDFAKAIFEEKLDIEEIFENLIAETIYCLIDIIQLSKTMGETYVFTHSFLGSIHEHLSFWIGQYNEREETYKKENPKVNELSPIGKLLEKYLGEEWKEQLSQYRGNQQAVSHYRKCLEMHNEGRAYHNMIDTMCYLKDDYNDRSDHFNIAEERFLIMLNKNFEEKIKHLEYTDIVKESELHKIKNYFNKIPPLLSTNKENKP